MTGTIKVIRVINPEILEELDGEVESQNTIIHFSIDSVYSFYVIEEGKDKYLYTNIGGQEYPLIYEDILEAAFTAHFNDDDNSISA